METVNKIDPNLKGKQLFDFAVANKSTLIAQKKFEMKRGDAFASTSLSFASDTGTVIKTNSPVKKEVVAGQEAIEVTSVINTCNWFDSHWDVHIPGIWKNSLSQNRGLFLLQEHKMCFAGIITEDIKAFTQKLLWKSLGVNAEGTTEALIFVSTITKKRNEFMYDQYNDGYVKNHSVGMRYIKIELAINDEDYKEEFAVWNKYIDQIANKQDAETIGLFWAIRDAGVVEGSAVVIGSNIITPTLEVKPGTEGQPGGPTDKQPLGKQDFNLIAAIQKTKFIN